MSREELKNKLLEWAKKEERARVIPHCTELFKAFIEDYSVHQEDFVLDISGFAPIPFSRHFEGCRGWFQMDSFEDLKVLIDLFRLFKIERSQTRLRLVVEGLFLKAGWAKEHNEWFMEELNELEKNNRFELEILEKINMAPYKSNEFDFTGKSFSIEAECQIFFIQTALPDNGYFSRIPEFFNSIIAKDERLWSILDDGVEYLFSSLKSMQDERDYHFHSMIKSFGVAYSMLRGKPVKRQYEQEWKTVLANLVHGDTTLIKPLIECYFESVKSTWPKIIYQLFIAQCQYALTKDEGPYSKCLRKMILGSSDEIFTKFTSDLSYEPSKDVIQEIAKRVDFDQMSATNPKEFKKLMKLSKDDGFWIKFTKRASFETVHDYLETIDSDEDLYDRLSSMSESNPKLFYKIMSTGNFVDRKFDQRPDDDHHGFYAEDYDSGNPTNLARMMCQLPSGNHLYTQGLINLVLEKNMPEKARKMLMKRLEDFVDSYCRPYKYKNKTVVLNSDYTTDLGKALETISEKELLNDFGLMQTITKYLFQKIKAGTATPNDLTSRVLLILCMLSSRRIDSLWSREL